MLSSSLRIQGIGQLDRNDRLEKLLSIEQLALAEEEPMGAQTPLAIQFEELGNLKTGWFSPESEPLNRKGLEMFKGFLDAVLANRPFPRPFIYPTPDGEARAEWSFTDWEVSATANLNEFSLHVHATQLSGDASAETDLSLRSRGDVDCFDCFANFLSQYKLSYNL